MNTLIAVLFFQYTTYELQSLNVFDALYFAAVCVGSASRDLGNERLIARAREDVDPDDQLAHVSVNVENIEGIVEGSEVIAENSEAATDVVAEPSHVTVVAPS